MALSLKDLPPPPPPHPLPSGAFPQEKRERALLEYRRKAASGKYEDLVREAEEADEGFIKLLLSCFSFVFAFVALMLAASFVLPA